MKWVFLFNIIKNWFNLFKNYPSNDKYMNSTAFWEGHTKEMPGVVTILLQHFENNLEESIYLVQIVV